MERADSTGARLSVSHQPRQRNTRHHQPLRIHRPGQSQGHGVEVLDAVDKSFQLSVLSYQFSVSYNWK